MNIPIWLFLCIVFVVCAVWHTHENRQLTRQWKNGFDAQSAKWLSRFAWSRSAQFLLSLACCALIAALYEWQLEKARIEAAIPVPVIVTKVETPAPVVAKPVVAQPAVVERKPLPAASNPVAEVFNPEASSSDKQSVMDALKKRYGDLLVTYFYLQKCGKTSATDYHIIISALSQEMASVNAPGRLQNDIVTAAQGSYSEMYSQSSCDPASTDTLATQFSHYVDVLSKEYIAK